MATQQTLHLIWFIWTNNHLSHHKSEQSRIGMRHWRIWAVLFGARYFCETRARLISSGELYPASPAVWGIDGKDTPPVLASSLPRGTYPGVSFSSSDIFLITLKKNPNKRCNIILMLQEEDGWGSEAFTFSRSMSLGYHEVPVGGKWENSCGQWNWLMRQMCAIPGLLRKLAITNELHYCGYSQISKN